jgi:antitoxin (DNA-binding transcriptional repressor) of toxin-antitoxin stability system
VSVEDVYGVSIIMKTATVTDLRYKFSRISRWLRDGELVTITKRGHPFATLTPTRYRKTVRPIDRMVRLQKIFPNGHVADSQAVMNNERGNR